MLSTLIYHFSATSCTPEEWLLIHSRHLQIHTLYHNALSVSDDGRIAFATGPVLNVLQPPLKPPLHSTLNSALRHVFAAEAQPSALRKDTTSTSHNLSGLIWADTAILLRDGSASLTMLRLPQRLKNSLQFSMDVSQRWDPTPLSLLPPPSEGLPSDVSPMTNRLRYITFMRISHCEDENDPNSSLLFTSFLVCATESATDLYPLDINASQSSFSRPMSSAFRIHNRCSITASCVDGVSTDSGLCTLIAVSDDIRQLTIYAVSVQQSNPLSLKSVKIWNSAESLPPAPILSLSWSLHSARNSFITLVTTSGNDVVILDWGYSSDPSMNSHAWVSPRIHCVVDAHEHIVTAVQICHDGSVISAGMDGRVVCWRINISSIQVEPTNVQDPIPTFAAVLQGKSEKTEPVMALKRTANAFAIVTINSTLTTRNPQETCDVDSSRKSNSSSTNTVLQLLVIPPYGTVDDVERSIIVRTHRLMSHPSLLDRPMMSWDAAHFIHFFKDCADAVVPRLFAQLVEMTNKLEAGEEESVQQFVQRTRALLWLCRVIDHPHSEKTSVNASVKDVSKRLHNSLLYVHYVHSLRNFVSDGGDVPRCTRSERVALESMCQFTMAWQAQGWAGRKDAPETVSKVQKLLTSHTGSDECLSSMCVVCASIEKEVPLILVGMDPATLRCLEKHEFQRCVLSGLPVTESVALECASCKAQALAFGQGEFEWLWMKKECVLCKGGLVDSQCEID